MQRKLKIGIVGCGAIGSSLADTILTQFFRKAKLVALYDINKDKANKLALRFKNQQLVVSRLEDLIRKSEFVIEATSAKCAFEIAKKCILSGCDIMIMSVGGLVSSYNKLEALAKKNNVRVFVPSGAICGIDGLKALSFVKINRVTLTTKKPPKAFVGVPYLERKKISLDNIKKETTLFEGNALAAIRYFPQNINVAGALSLAGIGAKKTTVRIIASPKLIRNIHEIEIESDAGKIFTRTENLIHPQNPKTSYLAVLSAIATLRQILEPIRIGT